MVRSCDFDDDGQEEAKEAELKDSDSTNVAIGPPDDDEGDDGSYPPESKEALLE